MSYEIAELRVNRGAKLLDEEIPGWADFVNMDDLHLDSCSKCVLGHIGREKYEINSTSIYGSMMNVLKLNAYEGIYYGFCRDIGMSGLCPSILADGDVESLNAAWKNKILERRQPTESDYVAREELALV